MAGCCHGNRFHGSLLGPPPQITDLGPALYPRIDIRLKIHSSFKTQTRETHSSFRSHSLGSAVGLSARRSSRESDAINSFGAAEFAEREMVSFGGIKAGGDDGGVVELDSRNFLLLFSLERDGRAGWLRAGHLAPFSTRFWKTKANA